MKALISNGVDTNKDGKIEVTEAQVETSLYIPHAGIHDLTGIQAFVNLTELYCNYNFLASLDVSKNTVLTTLNCDSNNQLMSLDLSKNTALTHLACNNNQLTSLDVSKNTALTYLDFNYNQLTSLDC